MKRLFFLICCTSLFAQEFPLAPTKPALPPFQTPALLLVDRYYSPEVGGEGMIPLLTGLHQLESHFIPIVDEPSTTWLARLGRFSEQVFIWGPLNTVAMTAQHEIFGHGFRVRSLGSSVASVDSYNIGLPPPYGTGGGYTYFFYEPEAVSPQEKIAITAGGVEATAILAKKLKFKWLRDGVVHPKEAMLYSESAHDLTNYAWTSVLLESQGDPHGDICEYIAEINETYGSNLTVGEVARATLWNLADPFSVYSTWSWWKYVMNGTTLSLPMIPIGDYRYLPGARVGLSPFGLEYYSEHFIMRGETPLYVYFKGGSLHGTNYYGAGFEQNSLLKWNSLMVGLRCDLWAQPHFGGSASVSATADMFERGAFYIQLGGKTEGYMAGETLDGGPIARFGLSLEM